MSTRVPQGFKVESKEPIDDRLVISKSGMKLIDKNSMPDVYLSVCQDDGEIYIYDRRKTNDLVTGYFRKIITSEDVIDASKIGEDITVKNAVGGYNVGDVISADTQLKDIIKKILG